MIERWINWYADTLSRTELPDGLVVFIENTTVILIIIGVAILADFIVKRIIIQGIKQIAKKTKNSWDDIFVKRKVFNRLAHLAPAIIIFYSLQYIFEAEGLVTFVGNLTQSYMVLVVLLVIDAFLNALHEIYIEREKYQRVHSDS